MADVRWRAFLPALILAPLIPAALGAAVLYLAYLGDAEAFAPLFFVAAAAVYGVMLGAPTYLVFGGIAFWLAARRAMRGGYAVMAFLANLASAPAVLVFFLVFSSGDAFGITALIIGFGSLFAPIWGGIFGALYRRFGGMA